MASKNSLTKSISVVLCIMLLCFTFFVSAIPAKAADTKKAEMPSGIGYDKVSETIENYWKEHEKTAAGMVISVFDRDGVIYSGSFGYSDKEKKIRTDQSTVFQWGSVSKMLIWTSAMQLKEQGKLELDKDIRTYLPEGFLKRLSYEKPITMLDLMNHTAGFEDIILGVETMYKDDIRSLPDYLREHQPKQVYEPGAVTAYSNWGASLAAYIIERISGTDYYKYVKENIFNPLKMNNTAISTDLSDNKAVQKKAAELKYYTNEGESTGEPLRYINLYPAGMCNSDLRDIESFAMGISNPESGLFKNKETYEELYSPSYFLGDTKYEVNCHGLWAMEFGENVIGHSGNTSGCTSCIYFDKKTGAGIAIMTNQSGEYSFCHEMVSMLMGKPEIKAKEDFNGYIVSTRSIFSGPFKVLSIFSSSDVTSDQLANINADRCTMQGVDKISVPGADFVIIGGAEYYGMNIPLYLWTAAVLFAFICLWVKAIGFVRHRKDNIKKPLTRWTVICCIITIMSLFAAIPGIMSIMSDFTWTELEYKFWSGTYLAIGVASAALIIFGIIAVIRERLKAKQIVFCSGIMLSLTAVIFNIIYWQLYEFWVI